MHKGRIGVRTIIATAMAFMLAVPSAAEFKPVGEPPVEVTNQIDQILSSMVAVVHVRLTEVQDAGLAYSELERQGYLKKKAGCRLNGVCGYEETKRAARLRPASEATPIRSIWAPACNEQANCLEAVWAVANLRLLSIASITHEASIASVEYLVEARLTEIARILWPSLSYTITMPQVARFERTENSWNLVSVWWHR